MLMGIMYVVSAVAAAAICYFGGAFCSLNWLWALPVSFLGCMIVQVVLFLGSYIVGCMFIDVEKPRDKDTPWFRWVSMQVIHVLVTILPVRVRIKGKEKVPKQGRFLLVCNHLHVIDPAILFYCFPKNQLAIVGKKETSQMFLINKAMPKLLCPTINRENDREALKTILRCIQLLNTDAATVAVFPEGRINKYCKLAHFRPGVFKIAQRTKVPIVVCTLRGSNHVFSRIMKFKRGEVELRVLGVVQPEEYEGKLTVDIAAPIYEMMAADLGPENVLTPEEEEKA